MAKKDFASSISKFVEKAINQIDWNATKIARDLFHATVEYTPVGDKSIDPHPGLLVNNWNPAVYSYDFGRQQRPGPSKTGAHRRIDAIIQRGIFRKDTFVTLCNSTEYAWRAEYGGWNFGQTAGEGRWLGTPPYRMVSKAISEIANKYR